MQVLFKIKGLGMEMDNFLTSFETIITAVKN
jgi:hypothetical protein